MKQIIKLIASLLVLLITPAYVVAEPQMKQNGSSIVIPDSITSIDNPPYTITDARISTLKGYQPVTDSEAGKITLPAETVDSLTYHVRIDRLKEAEIRKIVFGPDGVISVLVCKNAAVRALLQHSMTVVLLNVENAEGDPMFATVIDNRRCRTNR